MMPLQWAFVRRILDHGVLALQQRFSARTITVLTFDISNATCQSKEYSRPTFKFECKFVAALLTVLRMFVCPSPMLGGDLERLAD
jgi:hypothetical protein